MKIAYLAPEIPALSATFVYNEILQLEIMGIEILPFSVHQSNTVIQEARINDLSKKVRHLYSRSWLSLLKDNLIMMFTSPYRYCSSLLMLAKDVTKTGVIKRTSWGLCYRFLYASCLARELLIEHYSHIHVHFADVPTDIAMYAGKMASISFSVTAHANDLFDRGWLLKEKVDRAKFFATISEYNKQFLIDLGAEDKKIHIVRCGVDHNNFTARKNFQPQAMIKIGLVARLVEKKGIDTLIQSVKILIKEMGVAVELHIGGSGPLLQDLIRASEELNLPHENIKFLGALPHSDVADFIKSLDIFVLPCKQDINGDMDGIPVALMEAMLSGVPVISTRLAGIPELIIHGRTGLLAKPDNAKDLALSIKHYIDNPLLGDEMVANAIKKVENDFSLHKNTNTLKNLFCT